MSRLAIIMLSTTVFLSSQVSSEVPGLLSYQGILLDSAGNPLPEPANVTFTIYDLPSGGSVFWQETQEIEFDENGRFNVLLGAVNPIDDDVFVDPVRWIGVRVEGDSELLPRTRIVSVGYAHRTGTIDGGSGGAISGDVTINGDFFITGKATIGPNNTNAGANSFVAGLDNTAEDSSAAVGGGRYNTAGGKYGTVGGGFNNNVEERYCAAAGGAYNDASDTAAFIGGGISNSADGVYSVVAGGIANAATGRNSFIGGGQVNSATAEGATLGGGIENIASGIASTVGGGAGVYAQGDYSTACGGAGVVANGSYAIAAGGTNNYANGEYSTVIGGQLNVAAGMFSFAAGMKAHAQHDGAFVWADHANENFISTADDQFLIRASGGVGIGTASPQGALDVSSTTGALIVPRMTTDQRDALSAVDGMIIYNTSDSQFNFYEDGAWVTK